MNTTAALPALSLLEALLRQEWGTLDSPLPWDSLLEVADEQRVAPLLYHRLHVADQLSCLPQPWIAQLLACYQESALRNALYLIALEEVVAALNRAGIEPILLKGAALAYAIYPHPALRPMGDLDLWASSSDFAAAAQLLIQAGWQPTAPGQLPLIEHKISHHLGLCNPGGFPRVIELHRRWMTLPAAPHCNEAEALVWQKAQPITVGCARARILAPVDHFIYLAAHLARHAAHEDRLLWYADLAVLVEHYGLAFEWSALPDRAAQLGLADPLAWVLDALERRLAMPIPIPHILRLSQMPPRSASAALFAPPEADWQQVRVERAWRMWRGLPGWAARLLMLQQILFPRPGLLARLYPEDKKLQRLFRYPQRWLDYTIKVMRLLWSRLG